MIRVLIADDSYSARVLLRSIAGLDSSLSIVAEAHNGEEAVRLDDQHHPDIILMDVNMPKFNGDEASRRILSKRGVPIILFSSSWNKEQAAIALDAMKVGAVAALPKPPGPGAANFEKEALKFIKTVKTMAGVTVVRHYRDAGSTPGISPLSAGMNKSHPVNFLAVGASTGGPAALERLFSNLPARIPAPVVVVQHISEGFLSGMLSWLGDKVPQPCRIPNDGEILRPGTIYFAPENRHMEIQRKRVVLLDAQPVNGLRPDVAHLFSSLLSQDVRNMAIVMLTGMGSDGAPEMKRLHDEGAMTYAQSQEDCLVYGMPRAVSELGGAQYIQTIEEIARSLTVSFQRASR